MITNKQALVIGGLLLVLVGPITVIEIQGYREHQAVLETQRIWRHNDIIRLQAQDKVIKDRYAAEHPGHTLDGDSSPLPSTSTSP